MASSITNFIGKSRNRSSGNSSGEKESSPENKKPKNSADDLTVGGDASEDEDDEVITALEMTGDVHSKLEWIINKLNKLDDIEISVKNIESTLTAVVIIMYVLTQLKPYSSPIIPVTSFVIRHNFSLSISCHLFCTPLYQP